MKDATEHVVVLDTSEPRQPRWRLASAVDHIPAELDEVGQPLHTEEGRLVLWVTTRLGIQLSLSPLPSPLVYAVNRVVEGGDPR